MEIYIFSTFIKQNKENSQKYSYKNQQLIFLQIKIEYISLP